MTEQSVIIAESDLLNRSVERDGWIQGAYVHTYPDSSGFVESDQERGKEKERRETDRERERERERMPRLEQLEINGHPNAWSVCCRTLCVARAYIASPLLRR